MKTVQVIAASTAVALTIGVLAVLGISFASAQTTPAPTQTAVVQVFNLKGFGASPDKPTPEPTIAPAPVAAPAPAPAPADSVHGSKVPWIPSSDPQNANGGDWDMSVCQGGSASTGADGTPYCD